MLEYLYVVGAVSLVSLIGHAVRHRQAWRFWSVIWKRASEISPDAFQKKLEAIIPCVGSVVAVIATYLWLGNHDYAATDPMDGKFKAMGVA